MRGKDTSAPGDRLVPSGQDVPAPLGVQSWSEIQIDYLRKFTDLASGQTPDRNMRRAALNLMEDAIAARESAQRADEERGRSDAALRESEARLRTLSDAVAQIMWISDAAGHVSYFNRRWSEYTGLNDEESLGLGWQLVVHPDDAENSITRWHKALATGATFETEYRLRRADGEYCWFIGRNVPLRDDEGKTIGWYGTATNIERLKQAEMNLQRARDELERRVAERTSELTGALERLKSESAEREKLQEDRRRLLNKLVSLQEEERGRISRELHDNLSQHMIAVKFGLDALEFSVESGSLPEAEDIQNLRNVVDTLIKAAHRQAWELRPAELDHLGLQAAVETYVRDWSERTGVTAEFEVRGLQDRLPPELEIVFYRVTQEALTNVARHANASEATVCLKINAYATLIVRDNGKGFDPSASRGRLGILGMRERVNLVGGAFDLSSSPRGTIITASVKLEQR